MTGNTSKAVHTIAYLFIPASPCSGELAIRHHSHENQPLWHLLHIGITGAPGVHGLFSLTPSVSIDHNKPTNKSRSLPADVDISASVRMASPITCAHLNLHSGSVCCILPSPEPNLPLSDTQALFLLPARSCIHMEPQHLQRDHESNGNLKKKQKFNAERSGLFMLCPQVPALLKAPLQRHDRKLTKSKKHLISGATVAFAYRDSRFAHFSFYSSTYFSFFPSEIALTIGIRFLQSENIHIE